VVSQSSSGVMGCPQIPWELLMLSESVHAEVKDRASP